MKRNQKIHTLTQLALLLALELVMWQTPLGYLRTPVLNLSFMTIPVAVGAVVLGPTAGAVLGTVFGLTSFATALTGSTMVTVLIGLNPVAGVLVTVGARLLCGLCCGLVFAAANKAFKGSRLAVAVGAFSCPLLNTAFFMGLVMLFYYNTDYIQGFCATYGVGNPIALVLAMVGVQGVVELVVCGAVSTVIGTAVRRFLKL